MKTVGDRIKERMKTLNIKGVDITKKLGVSSGGLSQWISNNYDTTPGGKYIVSLATILETTPEWLLEGKGKKEINTLAAMFAESALKAHKVITWDNPQDLPEHEFVFVPVYKAKMAAGSGKDNNEQESSKDIAYRSDFIRNNKKIHTTYLCVVFADGDSMMPIIADRDTLLIDRGQTQVKPGQVFVFTNSEGGEQVKRLYLLPDGNINAVSDNKSDPSYAEPILHRIDEINIIGRVVERTGSGGL